MNVIFGFPKSAAASQFVKQFWAESVTPEFPNLRLEEVEPMQLMPFITGRKSKTEKAVLDFSVFDDSKDQKSPILFIEMKSGPGSIDDMKQFQLDINDSNAIASACNELCVPGYIFHVQVKQEYFPPTKRCRALNIWWTDCFTFEDHLQKVATRRDEGDKSAGYYSPMAFRTMDAFLVELRKRSYLRLQKKIKKNPLPVK